MAFKSTAGTTEYSDEAESYIPRKAEEYIPKKKISSWEKFKERIVGRVSRDAYVAGKTIDRDGQSRIARTSRAIQRLAYKKVPVRGGGYRTVIRGQGKPSARMIRAASLVSGYNIPVPRGSIRRKGEVELGVGNLYQDEYGQVSRPRRSGSSRAGRPRGTYDFRYARYGGVYGYRKYMAYQRRLALLRARGQGVPQSTQQAYSEQSQMETQMPAQPQTPQPQAIPQQPTGVKLWDPNFMKLSTGQAQVPVKKVDALNPELPQGDKYGDYYTEPDFFSGKQVLRRRSQDKLFKW